MKPKAIDKRDLKAVSRYHILYSNKKWKFKKEGKDKAIYSCTDKSTLMTEAIYYLANDGGYCWVHKENGDIDFIMSNWYG
jgi:hypothetical protein